LVTEPSSNTSRIACDSSGAIDRQVSLSKRCSSVSGSVLVTTISVTALFLSRSTAGPDMIGWVAAMTTPAAPSFIRASAACTMVPPVSIMSSTSTQIRPRTSPTTRLATVSLGRSVRRVLWMKARGAPPSWADHRSATLIRPASGLTTARRWSPYFSRTWSARIGRAIRWSTGPSKNPWIWSAWRSTVISRSAPAVLKRSAISRAEIGSRPRCFLS
jgi:hypothetical protein